MISSENQLLPREIYHSILEYLPLENLFRSANLVCHEFYQIIHQDPSFQLLLYLNNFSRNFQRVDSCFFDEKSNSCVMRVELLDPKEKFVDIFIMKELKTIKNPFVWKNIISYELERPLVLIRVYNLKHYIEKSVLLQAIFDPECTALFCELCKLYEMVYRNRETMDILNIFNVKDYNRSTLLMNFAYSNAYSKFIWMCENLLPPMCNNDHFMIGNRTYGQNCLHIACARGSTQIVEYLIEKRGMDLNATDFDGYTCLHLAACKQNYSLCKYLLDHGADKHKLTLNGFRAVNLVNTENQDLKKLLKVTPVNH